MVSLIGRGQRGPCPARAPAAGPPTPDTRPDPRHSPHRTGPAPASRPTRPGCRAPGRRGPSGHPSAIDDERLVAGRVARGRDQPDAGQQLGVAVVLDVARCPARPPSPGSCSPARARRPTRPPGRGSGCRAARRSGRSGRNGGASSRGDDVVELDSGGPEQLGQGADRRPVGRLDLGVADADPGVEHQDAVGMDDREGHHDPRPPGERAAIGVHEVGDMEGLDPDRGRAAASSDGRPTASPDGTKGPWDGIRPRC